MTATITIELLLERVDDAPDIAEIHDMARDVLGISIDEFVTRAVIHEFEKVKSEI